MYNFRIMVLTYIFCKICKLLNVDVVDRMRVLEVILDHVNHLVSAVEPAFLQVLAEVECVYEQKLFIIDNKIEGSGF